MKPPTAPTPAPAPTRKKPHLYLSVVTPEAIAILYQKLTGKAMSAEERKYAEEKLGAKK